MPTRQSGEAAAGPAKQPTAKAKATTAEPKGGRAAKTKAATAEPKGGTAAKTRAATAESKGGTAARRKAATAGTAEKTIGRPAKTTARRYAGKAGTAGETPVPAAETTAAPKAPATDEVKAKVVTKPAETPTGPAETTAEPPGQSTTETTVTVDLRVPEPPAPDVAPLQSDADDGAPAAAERAPHRAAVRTAGVVAPTRAPAPERAGTASTRPAATRPPVRAAEKVWLAEEVQLAEEARLAEEAALLEEPGPAGARTVESPDSRAMQARRRRTMLLVFVIVAIVVVVVSLYARHAIAPSRTAEPAASQVPPVAPAGAARSGTASKAKAAPPADAATTGPSVASGKFTYVTGYGPLMGASGMLRRFKVAVESTIGQGNGGDFADEIDSTLGDPRSWITGRDVRLQRVPQQAAAAFTIYLASARTSERMCAAGGLATKGYTSCRLPGQVIINEDRWQNAVPGYGATIATYRAYAINHEVGHELGHSHEACPGDGQLAPVMQQQTYGLNGCIAYAWPYLEGKRYAGPSIG
jgi:hypothetical protein